MKPIYWGIFFNKDDVCEGSLSKKIQNPHVTYGFRTSYPEEIHGMLVVATIVGYANNEYNEAFEIDIPEWTRRYYEGAKKVHMTISVSESGRPVDSAKLIFHPTPPIKLEGVFGYFDRDGVHLE